MKIAIHVSTVRALLLFAGNKDVRYYLNGVYIESTPGKTLAIATNGCTMAAASLPMLGDACGIIVPRELLEQAVKAVPKKTDIIVLEFAGGDRDENAPRPIRIESGAAVFTGHEIAGKFPEWRRVMPAKVSRELAYYNVEYLRDVGKAAQILSGRPRCVTPAVVPNGSGPGLAVINKDFVAVVMPMRMDNPPPPETLPEWVHSPAPEEVPA